ncbi:MAG: T9SS type A sorting domain-containing protein [Ferruginibacter sp.]
MWNFVSKLAFTISLFLSSVVTTKAQTEYLVRVNPANANLSKVDSLRGVRFIQADPAYNELTKSFTFIGFYEINQAPYYLFSVNALTGSVISNPVIPINTNLVHLKYSKSTGKLYGIISNINMVNLVQINPASGSYIILKDFPDFIVSDFAIDETNQRMFISGDHNSGSWIYSIDLFSGTVINQIATSERFWDIQYDNNNHKIYCLSRRIPSPGTFIWSIASINELTGLVSPIADIPNVTGIRAGTHQTLDEGNHIYYFSGNNANAVGAFIYGVNVNTGAVMSSALYPTSGTPLNDNLIFFRYDNNSEKMYAMFWEAHTTHETPPIVIDTSAIIDSTCNLRLLTKVYINPYSHKLVIDKGATLCKVTLNVYNMLGQIILKGKIINDGHNEIDFSSFATGIYFYKFISSGKSLLSGRVLK